MQQYDPVPAVKHKKLQEYQDTTRNTVKVSIELVLIYHWKQHNPYELKYEIGWEKHIKNCTPMQPFF